MDVEEDWKKKDMATLCGITPAMHMFVKLPRRKSFGVRPTFCSTRKLSLEEAMRASKSCRGVWTTHAQLGLIVVQFRKMVCVTYPTPYRHMPHTPSTHSSSAPSWLPLPATSPTPPPSPRPIPATDPVSTLLLPGGITSSGSGATPTTNPNGFGSGSGGASPMTPATSTSTSPTTVYGGGGGAGTGGVFNPNNNMGPPIPTTTNSKAPSNSMLLSTATTLLILLLLVYCMGLEHVSLFTPFTC